MLQRAYSLVLDAPWQLFVPRRRDRPHRAGLQPRRGRAARRARSDVDGSAATGPGARRPPPVPRRRRHDGGRRPRRSRDLRIEFAGPTAGSRGGRRRRVLGRGRRDVGLVGESGSRQDRVVARRSCGCCRRAGRGSSAARSASTAATCVGARREAMREVRGSDIAMIFQEPMTSLNPAFTVGDQIAEAVRAAPEVSSKAARRAGASRCSSSSASPTPRARARTTTRTQLSGGMRQRAMIAMALVCEPEAAHRRRAHDRARRHHPGADPRAAAPRSSSELGMAMLFVTHDLGVVADICDRVSVMYAGQVVEQAPVDELFARPAPPVHRGPASASMPQAAAAGERLRGHPGQSSPSPAGCRSAAASTRAAPTPQDRCADGAGRRSPGRRRQRCVALRAPASSSSPERHRRCTSRPTPPSRARRAAPRRSAGCASEFPVRSGRPAPARSATCGPSTASTSTSRRARRSASSARAGRASRRPAGCAAAPHRAHRGVGRPSTARDVTELTGRGPARGRGRRCRWSSRTRTRRSTRCRRSPTSSASRCRSTSASSKRRRDARVVELLEQVGLGAHHMSPLPVRVLGRPAPAHRHRPGPGARARAARRATSRSAPSTCRRSPRSSTCCATSRTTSASPTCSSPTTSRSCATSATASP